MRSLVLALAMMLAWGATAAEDCLGEPFVKELSESGDAFRAASILKEREFHSRGTDAGFGCARMLLGLYLRHEEFDAADAWLTKMLVNYRQTAAIAPPGRLRAEVAYLFGNYAEAENRSHSEQPSDPEMADFARAMGDPFNVPTPACSGASCDNLRYVLHDAREHGLKSPAAGLALGLVPGLGQVYAGRLWSGAASFFLNAALIGVSTFGVIRREYAFALFSGSIATGTYLGSIYAGYEAVRRENELREEQVRGRIKSIAVDVRLLRLAF